MKFDIIYSDPNWEYNNNLENRPEMGGKPYKTLSLDVLKTIPVMDICKKDTLLFQWCTLPMLPEGLELLRAWGFTFVCVPFVWIKLNQKARLIEKPVPNRKMPDLEIVGGLYSGLGSWTAGNVEFVMLGRKGKGVKRVDKSVK